MPSPSRADVAYVPQHALAERMDASYWRPVFQALDARLDAAECVALGDLNPYIRYGAIVPGRRPTESEGDVIRIDPPAFRPTGLDWSKCIRIESGSPWDVANARVRPGDLLIVRCGVASVGRSAVFAGRRKAVVGCFVDLVRQDRLCPYYLCAFLHSLVGRLQMERCMSGVGTPNLSFEHIRRLRVPRLDANAEAFVSEAWRESQRAHAAGARRRAARLQAEAAARFDFLAPRLDEMSPAAAC